MSHKAEAAYQDVSLLNALEAALAVFNRFTLCMEELAPRPKQPPRRAVARRSSEGSQSVLATK